MSEKSSHALNNNVVCQIGFVVQDIEASSRAWADLLGVEVPAWTLTDPPEVSHTVYGGEPSPAQAKLAFFRTGPVAIELIEPVGGPSTWQEHLDAYGEGVHHIAFQIEDMDGQVRMLADQGMPTVQRGDFTGGCYSYVDASAQLGVILELLGKRNQ